MHPRPARAVLALSAVSVALAVALPLALAQGQPIRVGIAFDAGGKNDQSFNQASYEGATRAQKEFGIELRDFEPSDPSQISQGIQTFAQSGFDLTVGVGFATETAITRTARAFPQQSFALIDSVSDAPNVQSLVFRENEGSYLVGYLAGLNTSTGIIGFLGGMDIPLIHKFEAGFTAGVKAANPRARVIAQYIGTTPAAWNDPTKAREIAASLRSRGVDIMFVGAGASASGAFDLIRSSPCLRAADLPRGVRFTRNTYRAVPKSADYQSKCAGDSRPIFFIGVDRNQNYLGDFDNNPATLNHGLTSMLKRVDVAVYEAIRSVSRGQFKGGVRDFGLRENGVGYALDPFNNALVSREQRDRLERIRQDIISGRVKAPTVR